MDGLTPEAVWQLNKPVHTPDLPVMLTDDPEVIAKRLADRGAHSRFETMENSSLIESRFYERAVPFLQGKGVGAVTINCTSLRPEQVAARIVTEIKQRMH